MMRIASFLLVAVLLSTCAISGTFAKYVTQANSHDNARVAYWGFNETTFNIDDLFANSYPNDKVSGSANIIAPGTTNKTTFSFKPQSPTAPEVAYKIVVSTADSTCAPTIANNSNIKWYLDNEECASFADLCEKIQDLSTDTISAGSFDPNWEADSTHEVKWEWLINDVSDVNDSQNIKDTALGNNCDVWVNLVITIRAEQID